MVKLGIVKGEVVSVDDKQLSPYQVLVELNARAAKHGVGRIDITENRLVGMKSRGCYETPGGTVMMAALRAVEELVLDKWFALQAGCCDRGGQVLPAVRALMKHADFNLKNPNRARSVIFSYCSANPGAFHRSDAAGYVFWAERVLELDALNPQVAARLARALDRWSKLAEPYRTAAREAIARVADAMAAHVTNERRLLDELGDADATALEPVLRRWLGVLEGQTAGPRPE